MTADTLAEALLAVDRYLAPSLAGAEARRCVYATAAGLPELSGSVIECHLGEPERLDLAVRRGPGERRSSGAPWDRSAWWCFDGDAFAGVYLGGGLMTPGRPSGSELEDWLDGLDRMAGDSGARVPAPSRAGLAALLERLPGAQPMTHLGVLPRRDPNAVRVSFNGVEADELPAWLASAGWPGDLEEVERVAGNGCAASRPLSVHLEVGEAVHETLGLELRPRTRSWIGLLAAALPARLRQLAPAIEAWRGFEFLDESWSSSLRSRWVAAARRVIHIKWSFRPGAGAALKAYLYLGLIRSEELSR